MKLKNHLLILAMVLALISCEGYLQEVPKSQISPENYYRLPEHAEAVLVGAYSDLGRDGITERMLFFVTDLERTARWNSQAGIGTFTIPSNNIHVTTRWNDHYKLINSANAVITHVPKIEMNKFRKAQIIAEAVFLRAMAYFNLVRMFGEVPLKLEESCSFENCPQVPVTKIYDTIIADLESNIPNMLEKGDIGYKFGRATRGAGQTLLSHVYLTRASMKKQAGLDGMEDFTKAAELAYEVIKSGRYKLQNYFPDVFHYKNQANDEVIFAVCFDGPGKGVGAGTLYKKFGIKGKPDKGGGWGNITATHYYQSIFEPTDVVRKDWSVVHGQIDASGKYISKRDEDSFEWSLAKYRSFPEAIREEFIHQDNGKDFIFYRYAEVLLFYAEALNEINGDEGEIFWALNELRRRARWSNAGTVLDDVYPRKLTYNKDRMPDITRTDYPNQASLREYIMFERGRELGGECRRWFDLVRWGNYVERIKFLTTYVIPGFGNVEPEWFKVASNVKPYHVLLPKPFDEIKGNPSVKQNEGYN